MNKKESRQSLLARIERQCNSIMNLQIENAALKLQLNPIDVSRDTIVNALWEQNPEYDKAAINAAIDHLFITP